MLLLVVLSIAILYSIFFSVVVLLRKIKSPEKSLKYCILNTALLPVRLLGVGPYKNGQLTLDSCIKVLKLSYNQYLIW